MQCHELLEFAIGIYWDWALEGEGHLLKTDWHEFITIKV